MPKYTGYWIVIVFHPGEAGDISDFYRDVLKRPLKQIDVEQKHRLVNAVFSLDIGAPY
jgi:hypothetical protein